MIREATAFLLEALAGDRPEQAALQSKLLEINLVTNPPVSIGGECSTLAFHLGLFVRTRGMREGVV